MPKANSHLEVLDNEHGSQTIWGGSQYVKYRACLQDLRAHWGSMASPPPQPQPPLTATHPQPLAAPPSQSGKAPFWLHQVYCLWRKALKSAKLHVASIIAKANVFDGQSMHMFFATRCSRA